ncbi:MAG: glycoside hydrolase family 3 C-terminal domain-containing protein [Bacteroidales bacterium]
MADRANGIPEGWYYGTEGGTAAAEILREVESIRKLTMSFPKSVGQLPLYYNHKAQQNSHGLHPDGQQTRLYPFGFAELCFIFLFGSSLLETMGRMNFSIVTVRVTNTGQVAGEEIVQLYIRRGELRHPARQGAEGSDMALGPAKPGRSDSPSIAPFFLLGHPHERCRGAGTFRSVGGSSGGSVSTTLTVR